MILAIIEHNLTFQTWSIINTKIKQKAKGKSTTIPSTIRNDICSKLVILVTISRIRIDPKIEKILIAISTRGIVE